jgi:putative component of membrane protein insertase Oxa1/YidC/SpoIIIJ protein YidD
MLKTFALTSIRLYQKFLSPHKGFVCAYRCHTGCGSCSAFGHRAIRLFGILKGLAVLRARLVQCGRIHAAHRGQSTLPRSLAAQRGMCDLDCGGCDVPDLSCDLPDIECGFPKGCGSSDVADMALDVAEEVIDIPDFKPSKTQQFVQKTRAWPNRKKKKEDSTVFDLNKS